MAKSPTSQKPQKNQVRIIGGLYKRRNLPFVNADGLRPTPDRLKETLFNWLMGHLQDARILDTCAGSGSLGVECLSRGASHCTFIEPNTAQARLLSATLGEFKIPTNQFSVINQTAQTALPSLAKPFDIIFLDPPYSLNLWQPLLALLIHHQLIDKNGLIYIEGDRELPQMIANVADFEIVKNGKVGGIWAYVIQIKA